MTPEDGPPNKSGEGRVLSPKELDIADDDSVTELEEGRYVISAGGGGPAAMDGHGSPGSSGSSQPVNERAVHEWLTERMENAETRHGFDVTTKVDGDIARKRVLSDDVVEVFDALLDWYARRVDENVAAAQVLGILLAESDHGVKYPNASLEASLARYGLEPEDSISSLLDAVDDDGGLALLARDD